MKNNDHFHRISPTENKRSHHLGQFILQLRRLERSPRSFGNAGTLTPSEIHTIDAIGNEGGVLMSELALRLGITKGAVTQIVDRLESKELAIRSPHPTDSRSIFISLTEKGREAFRVHEEIHVSFYQELRSTFSEEEIDIFERCLMKLTEAMKR